MPTKKAGGAVATLKARLAKATAAEARKKAVEKATKGVASAKAALAKAKGKGK